MKILGKPGFCIVAEIERPRAELVHSLRRYPIAIIGDGFGRRGIMDAGIKPLDPALSMAGPAVTVEVHPADNLMIHAALRLAREGDVLVVNAHGNLDHGLWGEITTAVAIRKKLAGVIVDGAVRDARELSQCGFPVYARGVNPAGGGKDGPGQLNMPISCGGVAVMPGDIVVGDADGVVVVPASQAEDAIRCAQERLDIETNRLDAIRNGPAEALNSDWVTTALRAAGVLEEGQDF